MGSVPVAAQLSVPSENTVPAGVSIVIPAYNEERGLPLVLAQLETVLRDFPVPHEIIVVDDGSLDGTGAAAAGFTFVKLVRHDHNRGYGAAIKTAMRCAQYDLICITDADGTYPNGTHIAEIEIDPATGVIHVVNYVIVDDFGVTLNPLLLEGQVHGGTMQGIGQALMEAAVYDAADGQLVTGTFMDYALPRAVDGPSITFETHNVPCKTNPLGVKGAGEAGAIGSCPAVVNAIVDGLYREYGIDHIDMPATAERVWMAIENSRREHRM